jgi:hypothetical protein
MKTVRLDPYNAASELKAMGAFAPVNVVAYADLILTISDWGDLARSNRANR